MTTPQLEKLILQSLPLFVPHEATEDSVFELLLREQVPADLATQIILFVPTAFGRIFMQKFQVDFPETFVLQYSDGTTLEGLSWADEPVYAAAQRIAEAAIDRGEWQENFHFEIASWSSEVGVISQALVEGHKPQSLTLQKLQINGDIGPRPISY
ncbi:hypothetical protein [Hymenobacter swuensis]|uniref:hypothetical protein n=1 Tax=Hymenobacter swuensis TaxID=1446467 RepID=UPI0012DE8BE7|nr:hypothetical protein [Hymenobacter swuensis]